MPAYTLPRFLTGKHTGWLSYLGFFLLAFVFSLYWTFPEQVVSSRLEQEVLRQTRGEVKLKVGRAQLWRLSGLYAQNVAVKVGQKPAVTLDSVRLRLRLLPLLLLRYSVYGQVQLEGGTVDVVLTKRGARATDVRVDFDAVSLGKPKELAQYTGIPLGGTLTGEVELFGVEEWARSQGKVELHFTKLALGPGDVRGLNLPQLPFGDVGVSGEVKDGTLQLKPLRQDGGKLKLLGGGKVILSNTLSRSGLDVCLRLGAEKDFLQQNPKLSAAFQLAQAQFKRDSEGLLNLPLQGALGEPEVRNTLCPRR